jgi:hypothetical protein
MATQWTETWLHRIDQYGGVEPMGAGPYGATIWTAIVTQADVWTSTELEDPPGSTAWEISQ